MKSSQHPLPFPAGQEKGDQQIVQPLTLTATREATWNQVSPSPGFWKGNSDPFHATPVALNPRNNEILRLAQQFVIFTAWPDTANAVFRTPIADTRNSHIKLDFAVQDEGLLHAILASGNRVSSGLTTIPRLPTVSQESVHKTRAVAILRHRLGSGETSPGVIALIRLLISLEFDNDDPSTALLHLRGLLAMAMSNLALLQEIEGLLLVCDVWIAMSLAKRPEISPTRYDPGARDLHDFNTTLINDVHFNAPTVLTSVRTIPQAVSPYGLDQPTVHLFNSALEIVQTKALMTVIEDPFLQQQVVKWMHRRATAVSGYLMIGYVDATELMRISNIKHPIDVRQSIIAASCLTAILFMNLEYCESPSNYNFSKLFQKIEPILGSVADTMATTGSISDLELYLWLLFMCALGNDVYSARGDISYSGWPAHLFHQFRVQLHLDSLEHLKRLFHTFLYHDIIDDFLVGLLSLDTENISSSIISWPRWCTILHHYVPDR
ncbi:hypothetical protein LTR84_008489 [Exophiala bonariae]|uniref:Transcription factor domain-containing protein n=1 Tax=Exophiala bonariae TaxID=1690606 RepID=A0AAV9N118_9EURO|nr:hypothetical protein LTR84_008489 [Exophiala bonariae]